MKQLEKIWDWLSNALLPQSNETIKVVVLCVVTATTFWFFNALNDNYSTRITYPIKFTYPDSALVEVKDLPDKLSINVSGGGWNLLRKTFWFTITPVEIPLEDPAGQKYILASSLYSVIADQMTEVQLNFIENDTLRIEIDSIRAVKSKLFVDSTTVDLADGYEFTSPIRLSIDSATFSGPERFIKNIPMEVEIEIEAEDISKNYSKEIYLSTFGSSLVNRNPVDVKVEFSVAKFIEQELMLPYKTINAPKDSSSYVFKDSLATLRFRIQEESAGSFDLDSIQIFVDFENIQASDTTVMPNATLLPYKLRDIEITFEQIRFNYIDE